MVSDKTLPPQGSIAEVNHYQQRRDDPAYSLKQQICDALAAFIRQRPGLDPRNYFNPADLSCGRSETYRQGVTAYRAEQRSIARDKRDAETLLQAVRGRESITAEMILEAAKRGRLSITVTDVMSEPEQIAPGAILERAPPHVTGHKITLDYCTGQYWPTEYRKAVAAVCASVLWERMRENMPKPDAVVATSFKERHGDSFDGVSAGDWLRRNARREFGSKLQRRWFN